MNKILFASDMINSPSFLFYSESLSKINGNFEGLTVDIKRSYNYIDYKNYDVALFMGSNQQSKYAKALNPDIITAIFEPRAAQNIDFTAVDFIIVNSLESKDFFSKHLSNIIVYYTYPIVPPRDTCPTNKEGLVLGYHGNLLHLDAMYPRITRAIEELNREIPVTLWAMYNIETLGRWRKPDRIDLGFPVVHIQYSEENYAKYMANVDIGLVPQLIPVRHNRMLRYLLGSPNRKYNERNDNYFLRFKETTNIGRHLVFAQYGIPMVSDMTPSACAFIDDESDSYIAYETSGWYRALQILAGDINLRREMGNKVKEKYRQFFSHDVLNTNLINYIRGI
jgi:hypothetical protein